LLFLAYANTQCTDTYPKKRQLFILGKSCNQKKYVSINKKYSKDTVHTYGA